MPNPHPSSDVLERLIEAALVLKAKGYSEHAQAASEAKATIERLSAELERVEFLAVVNEEPAITFEETLRRLELIREIARTALSDTKDG
jgi:hypothetical protein